MAATPKVVLILGAGARVGEHVARQFASQGYKVASASRSAKSPDNTSEAIHVEADLSNPESVSRVFSEVKASIGIPSVVVYNAAAATFGDAKNPVSLSLAEFTKSLNINTLSAYAAVQKAVQGFEQLPDTSSRTFIYTGNILNTTVMPGILDLGVGKAATSHIIQAAATAYSDRGFK
ncbi:NAD(P)-binding protein [Karstenula rhodostoma CBS 690.94]|uniref:NAD(P)-binding protein n=1 Tax=Karstenula rhodostoma CBS 690.94 TaxID=1392251 RepID=A0A9P4PQD4_9PLEO|nr:NAD(P)-binding protein [Karstenula rhodostoma CBS 690.94]